MKIYAIAFGLSIAAVANAQSNPILPGGITDRTLECVPVNHFVGVQYGLVIQTQALAPEYSVRGAFFTTTEIYPGAVTYYTKIDLQSQDRNTAFFNLANQYKVVLNKKDFTAQIILGNIADFNCFEKK
jgi:hypothetical protein